MPDENIKVMVSSQIKSHHYRGLCDGFGTCKAGEFLRMDRILGTTNVGRSGALTL
jgi:hypothetical protein